MQKTDFHLKFDWLKKIIQNNKQACLLFSSSVNRFWLTGYQTSFGYLVITNEQVYFLVDGRYYAKIKANINPFEVILYQSPKDLIALINKLKIKTIYFEEDYVTYRDYQKFLTYFDHQELIGLDSVQLRKTKTDQEIALMQKAADIAIEAMNYAKSLCVENIKETDIKKAIINFFNDRGCDRVSFDPIVAFGENAAIPHHCSTERKLKKGEFILIDLGCVYQGYCSDMTRTFWIGKPTKEMKEIYDIVLKANLAGIKKAIKGNTCQEVDLTCRKIIEQTKYKDCFIHSTGHGVGIEIHEEPYVNKNNISVLENNQVITIEPGIYVNGLGGVRIEDSIVIKDNEALVLTKKLSK